MNLNRITITGADDKVPQWELHDIAQQYPFVEWGILASETKERTNRYPSREWIQELYDIKTAHNTFNLALHLCGRWTRDLLLGKLTIPNTYIPTHHIRIQLNFRDHTECNPEAFAKTLSTLSKIPQEAPHYIFQLDKTGQNKHYKSLLFQDTKPRLIICPLFDASGGTGKTPDKWPKPENHPINYHGYSGGLGPTNLEEQLPLIGQAADDTPIWIDMESGVRTNNEFDLEKVIKCLKICQPYITPY